MFNSSRKTVGSVALVLMLCVAAAIPGMSSAKTKTSKLVCIIQGNPKTPNDVTATISCPKPYGKGKQTGTVVIPKVNGKWKFKGGSFTWKTVAAINGPTISGKSTLTNGTGKFKGCTAKGSQKGPLATARIIYKFTVTCKK